MIQIKIYEKGRDETHIYTKCRCPEQQMSAQLGALLIATCRIARNATTKPDKDAFLRMMSTAWDIEQEKGGQDKV